MQLQLNPDIAHLKGLVKIMLYTKDFTIANIEITIKMLLWTKICMLYFQDYVKNECAKAGFHCTLNGKEKKPWFYIKSRCTISGFHCIHE